MMVDDPIMIQLLASTASTNNAGW